MLTTLDLSSQVLAIKSGAVPLFHSIFSDVSLNKRKLRFGQLVAGFHMCSHELARFGKKVQVYLVSENIENDAGHWVSVFSFTHDRGTDITNATVKRLEEAMPILTSQYFRDNSNGKKLVYKSIERWAHESLASERHLANGLKLVNYGGHKVHKPLNRAHSFYAWRGVSRVALMPTLTSILLLSFSLASIVRYRPMLLENAMNSPVALVIDTFIGEADGIFIPTLRNLLYREELAIGNSEYL